MMKNKTIYSVIEEIIVLLFIAYFTLPLIENSFGANGHVIIMASVILFLLKTNDYTFHLYYWGLLVFEIMEMTFVLLYHQTFFYSAECSEKYYLKDIFLRYLDLFAVMMMIDSNLFQTTIQKKRIKVLSIFILLSTLLFSILKVSQDPEVIRNMASQQDISISSYGLANFNIVYGIIAAIPIIYDWGTRGYREKLLSLSIISIIILFEFTSAFTIAILSSIIVLLSCLFSNDFKKSTFLTIIIIILCLYLNPIILWIIDIIESASLRTRLLEIYSFINSGEIGSDMTSRFSVYTISLKSFIQNPILGIFLSIDEQKGIMTGDHSRIFDLLARFGFFFAIYLYVIISFTKNISKLFGRSKSYIVYQTAVIIFILEILNPIYEAYMFFYGYFLALLFIPQYIQNDELTLSQNNKEDNNESVMVL